VVRPATRSATASHIGLVYDHNEDCAYTGRRLFAIADGVGGEAAGEVASALAIEAVRAADTRTPRLDALVADASRRLAAAVVAEPAHAGMATTLTVLAPERDAVRLAHLGDSRAYRLRDAELSQLTRDDTFVQQLVDSGHLAAADIPRHPHRSVVTRVLDGRPVPAWHARLPAAPGDRYLLCSDGLPDAASGDDIAGVLRDEPSPRRAADRLIELALAGGGPDNVTVVVVDLEPGHRWPWHR
jgi:protein phosphatase